MGEKKSRKSYDLESLKSLAGSLVSQFPNNRLYLIIAGSILLLAVAGGVISLFIMGGRTAAEQELQDNNHVSAINGDDLVEQAEVLPQQIRSNEDSEESDRSAFSPLTDPFGGPMKLTGIVTGGRGGSMAIVESSGTSYIVSEGDYVDDLWAVYEISRDIVIMRAHNQEVSLFLDQAPVIRELDSRWDVEDDEADEDDPEEGA